MKDQQSRADHPFYNSQLGKKTSELPASAGEHFGPCKCPGCSATREIVSDLAAQFSQVITDNSSRPEVNAKMVTVALVKLLGVFVAENRLKTSNPLTLAGDLANSVVKEYLKAHSYLKAKEAREGAAG